MQQKFTIKNTKGEIFELACSKYQMKQKVSQLCQIPFDNLILQDQESNTIFSLTNTQFNSEQQFCFVIFDAKELLDENKKLKFYIRDNLQKLQLNQKQIEELQQKVLGLSQNQKIAQDELHQERGKNNHFFDEIKQYKEIIEHLQIDNSGLSSEKQKLENNFHLLQYEKQELIKELGQSRQENLEQQKTQEMKLQEARDQFQVLKNKIEEENDKFKKDQLVRLETQQKLLDSQNQKEIQNAKLKNEKDNLVELMQDYEMEIFRISTKYIIQQKQNEVKLEEKICEISILQTEKDELLRKLSQYEPTQKQ